MNRLDKELVKRGLMASRSQALNYIKMGKIKVGGRVCQKPAYLVGETDQITIFSDHQYVSRAGFKLESVAQVLQLDFKNKVVLTWFLTNSPNFIKKMFAQSSVELTVKNLLKLKLNF